MFDIDYLLIPEIAEKLNNIKIITKKTDFLLQLVEFEIYFRNYTDKISKSWQENTGKRYDTSNFFLDTATKRFVIDYAEKINSLSKVKELINKILSIDDGVYDYDTVIANAENEMSVIQNIDDFEFTAPSNKQNKAVKTSLDNLFNSMPKK